MRSPYAYFVHTVAKLLGSKYPEQYDSTLHRQIQIILSLGTVTLGFLSIYTSEPVNFFHITIPQMISVVGIGFAVFIILLAVGIWITAILRYESIMKYELEQITAEKFVNANPEHGVEIVQTVTEYIKMFVFFAVLYTVIPYVIDILLMNSLSKFILNVTVPLRMYYILLFVQLTIILFGRWFNFYISNDNVNSKNKNTTAE